MNTFVSIKTKLIRKVMSMLIVIFSLVLVGIVALNMWSASNNIKSAEQTIQNAIIAKGKTLAKNNSMAMAGMAADNAFLSVEELVVSTVGDDEDIIYGIFMDGNGMPWTDYVKGGSKQAASSKPLSDSLALWAGSLVGPAYKIYHTSNDELYEFAAPVRSSGEVLGYIRYGLSSHSMHQTILKVQRAGWISLCMTIGLMIALFGCSLVIAYYLLRAIAEHITRPIGSLVASANSIAGGNYLASVRPESDDEIGVLADGFDKMRVTVKRFTDHLQDLVDEKMQQVNDILNNIDQGLFTVNLDGTVNKEYSARANDILRVPDVSNCSITELFRLDLKQEEAFRQWIRLVADRHECYRWNKLVRLSPVLTLELGLEKPKDGSESGIMEYVSVSYQKVFDKLGNLSKIMVLALDETEKRSKDLQMKQERDRHENEVKVILGIANTPADEIVGFMDDTRERIERLVQNTEAHLECVRRQRDEHPDGEPHEITAENIDEMFRDIHTIKGNGGSYGFEHLTAFAHKAEDELEELRKPLVSRRVDTLGRMRAHIESMLDQVHDIEGKIELIFGTEKGISVKIPEYRIRRIQDLCKSVMGETNSNAVECLTSECSMLSWKPLSALARKYQMLARKLARQLGKHIEFVIVDEKQLIPPGALLSADEALVHIVRNALGHGIESNEQRSEMGKGPGVISLSYVQTGSFVEVRLSDDGAGIDTERIVASALAKGLISNNQIELLSEDQKLSLIFTPGISTAIDITEVSGRGVGMDIVFKNMSDLNGNVRVETLRGKGTTFILRYPFCERAVSKMRADSGE